MGPLGVPKEVRPISQRNRSAENATVPSAGSFFASRGGSILESAEAEPEIHPNLRDALSQN